MDTFYFTRKQKGHIWPLSVMKGESRLITVDWSSYTGLKSTTISTSSFESESGGVSGITGAGDTDNTSFAMFGGTDVGTEYVTASVTLANGETLKRRFLVCVADPLSTYVSDYR